MCAIDEAVGLKRGGPRLSDVTKMARANTSWAASGHAGIKGVTTSKLLVNVFNYSNFYL